MGIVHFVFLIPFILFLLLIYFGRSYYSILSDLYFENKKLYNSLLGENDKHYGAFYRRNSISPTAKKKIHKMVMKGEIGTGKQRKQYLIYELLKKAYLYIFAFVLFILVVVTIFGFVRNQF